MAKSDLKATFRDMTGDILVKAKERLENVLNKLILREKLDEAGKRNILSNISFTTLLEDAKDCDLIGLDLRNNQL